MTSEATDVAVLFADVSGSTKLYETVGDAEALEGHRPLPVVRADRLRGAGRPRREDHRRRDHGGLSRAPDQAAEAAAEMQARISEQPPVGRSRLAIRVGFHFGPAIAVEGDVFGDSVNVAARMTALAKGEQVILSAATADALSPLLRSRVREIDSLTVKGKQEEIGIFELIWQGRGRRSHVARHAADAQAVAPRSFATARARSSSTDAHPTSHARPRRAERRRRRRQDGLPDARAHRAPPGQVRPDRPELERHLRHRRRRARDPFAARGIDPARPRPCLLRPRLEGRARRDARVRLRRLASATTRRRARFLRPARPRRPKPGGNCSRHAVGASTARVTRAADRARRAGRRRPG